MCTGPDPRSHYHVFILLQNMWGKAKFLQASGSMLEKADMRTKLNLIVDKRGQQREDCKDTMRCEFPVEVQWRIKQSFPKNGFCTQNTYMYALYWLAELVRIPVFRPNNSPVRNDISLCLSKCMCAYMGISPVACATNPINSPHFGLLGAYIRSITLSWVLHTVSFLASLWCVQTAFMHWLDL